MKTTREVPIPEAYERIISWLNEPGQRTRRVAMHHIATYYDALSHREVRKLLPPDYKSQKKNPRDEPELRAAVLNIIRPRKDNVWLPGLYAVANAYEMRPDE